MIKRLFGGGKKTDAQGIAPAQKANKKAGKAPRLYATPAGQAAYAVGDIHGCYDAMLRLLENIERHAAIHAPGGYTLIFLGDLMDRGPQSRQVIDYLMHYRPAGASLVFLTGNHEEVFLETLRGDIDTMRSWFRFGGKDTVRSYGVEALGDMEVNPKSLIMRIQRAVPRAHIEFMSSFQNHFVFGDYLFVHAGIKPGVPLAEQKPADMRWIRQRFLNYTKAHDYKIVHGHTVVPAAENLPNRIAVDTGAYDGGPLTAVFLKGTDASFLTSDMV